MKPALIWHSGKLRAKQTAEAFWRHCNPLSTFAAVRGLQPTDSTTWIVDAIAAELASSDRGEARDLMLVGHYPQMPQLLAHLVGGGPDAPSASFPLNGMVALENVNGLWIESWRLEG